jgi:hypothetical protein
MKYVLYLYISTFRGMCAVPHVAVFCSSLISSFPGMLLRYYLGDFEMVPVAIIITGITGTSNSRGTELLLFLVVVVVVVVLLVSIHNLPSTRLLIWTHERNTIKLHVQFFLRVNIWMFETCRTHYN